MTYLLLKVLDVLHEEGKIGDLDHKFSRDTINQLAAENARLTAENQRLKEAWTDEMTKISNKQLVDELEREREWRRKIFAENAALRQWQIEARDVLACFGCAWAFEECSGCEHYKGSLSDRLDLLAKEDGSSVNPTSGTAMGSEEVAALRARCEAAEKELAKYRYAAAEIAGANSTSSLRDAQLFIFYREVFRALQRGEWPFSRGPQEGAE